MCSLGNARVGTIFGNLIDIIMSWEMFFVNFAFLLPVLQEVWKIRGKLSKTCPAAVMVSAGLLMMQELERADMIRCLYEHFTWNSQWSLKSSFSGSMSNFCGVIPDQPQGIRINIHEERSTFSSACLIFIYVSISPKWSWYVRGRDFARVSRFLHPKRHLLAYPHRNQLWARNAFSFDLSLWDGHGGNRQSFGRHPVSLLRGMACATCVASVSWTWTRLATWNEILNSNEVSG